MKGRLNVMASLSRDIIRPITPKVHNEEDFATRMNVSRRREVVRGEKERKMQTKHISSGIEGLTAHFYFFLKAKNNSSHECVPNKSTTTSQNKYNNTHTNTAAATTAAAAKTGVFYSLS